jgi:hypothetical protein
MRKEYDFSKGTRGKHAGKRLRIAGDARADNGESAAARIQQIIERDLRSREDFKVVWKELNQAERENIRADWLKKISTVLTENISRPSRRT